MTRYVRQFREIFTEEGRRQVKITHQVPGRAPVVTYTQVCNTATVTTTRSAATTSVMQTTTAVRNRLIIASQRYLCVVLSPNIYHRLRPITEAPPTCYTTGDT